MKDIFTFHDSQFLVELFQSFIHYYYKYLAMKNITFLSLFILLSGCSQSQTSQTKLKGVKDQKSFNAYWHDNKAEITSYHLEQARYGELHNGNAVLIFVTEDFSKNKQVKLDNGPAAGDDRVPILKLNFTKKFDTGIYPYSMMQSVFTPVDLKNYPRTIKTSMTSQEWCGHAFSQYNLKGNSYQVSTRSYFESSGDTEIKLSADLLEDEVWTRIRLNPNDLPTGEKQLLPGTFYIRLMHKENKAYQAQLSLDKDFIKDSISQYTITYPELERTLKIRFQKNFPYQILSWDETYISGFGEAKKTLTTTGTINKTLLIDYWNKHNNSDAHLREELGLK